jgi:hypothetical protein
MSMTLEEMEVIRGIINSSMDKIQHDFDEKIHDGFDMLNKTLEAKINTRVSDMACQLHRKDITEKMERKDKRITILETKNGIFGAALVILVPCFIAGIVYGILMYQKVEDLRNVINKSPQIVKVADN